MKTAEEWIRDLDLMPHPEGGYYRQTDLSQATYSSEGRELPLYTNIHFLLTKESPSHFHQLTSDELWFYHAGRPLTVHSIHPDGTYEETRLGLGEGEKLQHTVKAGVIFGSTVDQGYSLVSCTVVPGFDFSDFRLFTQEELLLRFPKHEKIIKKLAFTRIDAQGGTHEKK